MASNLEAWTELKGPELLIKKIVPESTTRTTPTHGDDEADVPKAVKSGDTVLMNLTGRQADSPEHLDGPVFQVAKSWLVTVGEPHCLLRAVEHALEFGNVREGQTVLVYSASGAHNFEGTGIRKYRPSPTTEEYALPAHSSVVYEVTVLQIVMDTSRLNPYFPIQKALTMKNIANDIYQCEWEMGEMSTKRSIHLYEKAARSMKALLGGTYFANVEEDHPQRKQCSNIMMDCYNNVVAVYLRTRKWKKAREAAQTALREEPDNAKALLRNAKAYMMDPEVSMEEKDEALKRAERVIVYKDKEDSDLRKLRAQWKKMRQSDSQ